MDKKEYAQVKKLIKDKKYANAKSMLEGNDLDLEGKKILFKVYMVTDKDKVSKLAFDLAKDGDKDALNQLAKFYIKDKKFTKAEQLYNKLVDENYIDNKTYLNDRLNLYKSSGQINQAIETCNEIMKKYPKEGDISKVKGLLVEIKNKKMTKVNNYMEAKKYTKVINELEGKYLTSDENAILLKAYIGVNAKPEKILNVISKIPKTKVSSKELITEGYEMVNAKDPKNAEVLTKLGTIYKETNNKEKMKELFTKIRENDLADNDEILKFKVDLYSKEDKYELASKWARRYIEKHPEDEKMTKEFVKLKNLQKEKVAKIKAEKLAEEQKLAAEKKAKEEKIKKEQEKSNTNRENKVEDKKQYKRRVRSPKYHSKEQNKNNRYVFNRKEKVPRRKRSYEYDKKPEEKELVRGKNKENLANVNTTNIDEKDKEKIKLKLNKIKDKQFPKKYKMNDKELDYEKKKEKFYKLVEANKYYSAGVLAIQLGFNDKAIKLLKESCQKEEKSARTYNALGKAYTKKHDISNAKEAFSSAVTLDKTNKYKSITKLADLYMGEKMLFEAEFLYNKAVERNEKNKFYSAYEHGQLGSIYTEQEEYEKAEDHLRKGIIEADVTKNEKDRLICKMKMSVMLAKEGHDDVAKRIYEEIIEKMPTNIHKPNEVKKHIMRHTLNNKDKTRHNVFKINPMDVYENIDFSKLKKNPAYLGDIYCMPYEDCGYEGGKYGTNKKLDYITIITEPYSENIITMYPSEKIEIKCPSVENKSNLEILKNLVKENKELTAKDNSLGEKIKEKGEKGNGRERE